MTKFVSKYASSFLTVAATLIVGTASWGFIHNPTVPQELKK